MLAGIVYLALGMKKVLTYVADPEHHDLGDALPWVPLVALFGGAVLYLVALSALRRRNIGGWNVQRLVAAAALVLLVAVGAQLPAVAAVGVLGVVVAAVIGCEAVVLAALIGYEAVVLATERDRVRHAGPH
jgi:low temperature requirement protein LtrA